VTVLTTTTRTQGGRGVPAGGAGASLGVKVTASRTRGLDRTRPDPLLKSGREELQCDVVRITAREPRAVVGIDDSTIVDAEIRQPDLPRLKVISTSAGECQVVQANSTLIEWKGVGWIREFVEPDECLTSDEPDSSSERARAFIPVKGHVEQSFVPLSTLRSRLLTVRVTCAMVGNSGTGASS
jgi:hypothetical protein